MSDPLVFIDRRDGPIEQVTYPDGVTAREVLDGLLTVTDSRTGDVVWQGRLEDPKGDG